MGCHLGEQVKSLDSDISLPMLMAHDLMLPEGVTSSLQYSKLIVPPIQWWLVLQGLEICKNFDAASAEIYYHTWGLVGLQGCLATSFNRSVAAAGMSLLLNFTISQKVGSLFRICMWWLPSLAAPQSLRLILCDSTLVLSPLWFTVLCRHRPHRVRGTPRPHCAAGIHMISAL